VANPGGLLKKQMYVRVRLRSRQESTGLLAPVSSILRDDENLPFVYLAESGGGYARHRVTLGSRLGDQYEIAAGLQDGDQLVVEDTEFVALELQGIRLPCVVLQLSLALPGFLNLFFETAHPDLKPVAVVFQRAGQSPGYVGFLLQEFVLPDQVAIGRKELRQWHPYSMPRRTSGVGSSNGMTRTRYFGRRGNESSRRG